MLAFPFVYIIHITAEVGGGCKPSAGVICYARAFIVSSNIENKLSATTL